MNPLRAQEIAKRRQKARAERYAIVRQSEMLTRLVYAVAGSGGSVYTVVVDRASVDGQTCTCPDFEKSRLGTCKHIEAVRREAGLPEEDPAEGPEWAEPDGAAAARDYTLPPGIVCFDIETLRLFSEVGGRRNLTQLGLAVAVTYDSTTNAYESWLEPQADGLIEKLRSAKLVTGYNIIRFDYPVLQAYTTACRLDRLPTLDLFTEISRGMTVRPGLAGVGALTLGYGKSGDGLEAVSWFRQGLVEKVIDYCRDDVRLVRNLLGFALENGYVRCLDGGRPVFVKTDWQRLMPG